MTKQILVTKKKKIALEIAWSVFLTFGPFLGFQFIVGVFDFFGYSIMELLVKSVALHGLVMGLLALYAFLAFDYTRKKYAIKHKSELQKSKLPLVIISVAGWIMMATGLVMFEVSILQTLTEMFPEAVISDPKGMFDVVFILNLSGPLVSLLIFDPKKIRNFFSSKYDPLIEKYYEFKYQSLS